MLNRLLDDSNKFKAIQALYWSGFSFFQMFFVYYLTVDQGFSNASVGIFLSIAAVFTLIGQTIWGLVTDKLQNTRFIVIMLFSVSTILISTYSFHSSLLIIGIVTCLIMFFEPSIPPILDSWTSQYVATSNKTNYSAIRLWGSGAFAVVATIAGRVSLIIGVENIFYFHAVFTSLAIIMCLMIRFKPVRQMETKVLSNLRELLKSTDYIIFVLLTTVIFTSFRMSLTYLPALIVKTGGDQSNLSSAWVIAAISEVIVFIFADQIIKKLKPLKTCLIGFVFFTIRIVIFYFATSHIWILSSQVLQGLSYGLFLPASLYFINSISKASIKTSAITIAVSFNASISGIIGNYLGGFIIDNYGLNKMYVIAIIANVSIITIYILYFTLRTKKNIAMPNEI